MGEQPREGAPVVVRPLAHQRGDSAVAQLPVLVEHPTALVGGDEQGRPPVGGVGDPLDEPELHEMGHLPAHRRRIGVDGVGMLGLVLGLDALEQTHEADELAADLVGGLQLVGRGHVSSEDPACVTHASTCSSQVCPKWTDLWGAGQAETNPVAARPAGVSCATALLTGFTTSPAAIRRFATPESAQRTPSTISTGSQPGDSSHRPAATARSTARSRPQICNGSSSDITPPSCVPCGPTAATTAGTKTCRDPHAEPTYPLRLRFTGRSAGIHLSDVPTNGLTVLHPWRRFRRALSCGA